MAIQGINKYAVPSLIGDYFGSVEEDLPVKQAYISHYIAQQTGYTLDSRLFLDCTERPDAVQVEIDATFSKISGNTASSWGLYNGEKQYSRCGIKDTALLKTIIQEGYAKGQKLFMILDIGAGNFQWGDGMRRYMLNQKDLPEDITIQIIGVRGERNNSVEQWASGSCNMYELGNFKVENLIDEFRKRGLALEGRVDMIVSRWCFPHLIDPLKTFGQAYNLLRPETGLFLGDGFYFFKNDQIQHDFDSRASIMCRKMNMLQLLVDLRAPVLVSLSDDNIDEFIIKRLDRRPCELDMRFTRLERRANYDTHYHEHGATMVSRYKRVSQDYEDKIEVEYPTSFDLSLYGSQHLYNWLNKHNLLFMRALKPLCYPLDKKIRGYQDLRASVQAASEKAVRGAEAMDAFLKAKEDEDLLKPVTERTDSPNPNGGLAKIAEWIAMHDCVILRSEGYPDYTYYHGEDGAALEDRRVIVINIDPATHLLDADEWPEFLKIAKCRLASDAFKKRILGHPIPHYYEFAFPRSSV